MESSTRKHQLHAMRRKKRWQQFDVEAMVELFWKQQQKSWEKFMEWEEKSMKMEAEEEAKRCQESQQHATPLCSVLVRSLNPASSWQVPPFVSSLNHGQPSTWQPSQFPPADLEDPHSSWQ